MENFQEYYEREKARVALIESAYGKETALEFVKRTICIYHTAVSTRKHFASFRFYRNMYIASISYFDNYLDENGF